MIDDCVHRDRRLADLAVADDQLTLTLPDRDEGVDRADAGLEGLLDGLPLDNRRRDVFDRAIAACLDGSFTVYRIAERIDDASQQRFTDGHRRDAARTAHLHPFLDLGVGSENNDADVVRFEIEGDALQSVGKLDELGLLHGFEAVNSSDTRTDLDDGPDLIFVNLGFEVSDLPLQNSRDFVSVDHIFES